MDHCNLYTDIATRTGGDIYIGVVGPVRTGKSTFIKRFMELMVLPEIQSEAFSQRARDELPQSAAGRTIMTTSHRHTSLRERNRTNRPPASSRSKG